MWKSSFALCTTSPSKRRRERHGRSGCRGEEHGATLTLPVTRAVVPIHNDRQSIMRLGVTFLSWNMCITVNIFLPGISIVTREAGLTVRSLSVVRAVALACLVVAISLLWVTMAITLARHAATTPSQGWTKAPGATLLTMRTSSPIWKRKHWYQGSIFDHNKSVFIVRYDGLTLAFITDPWCCYAGRVEVAATVYITFDTTENQSGWIRRPPEGTFTLKPWASTTQTLTTLIVAPMWGIKKQRFKMPHFS